MATVWKGSRPSSMKACDTANTLEMVRIEDIGNGDNEKNHLVVIFFPGPFQLLSKPTTLLKSKATRQLLNLAVRMIPDPGFHASIF